MTLRIRLAKLMKAVGINRIAARIYYRHFHGFASAGRQLPEVVARAMERAKEMGTAEQGDYYEFGIFKGHTFLSAQRAADERGIRGMRFYGFDSFQGLPEPKGLDRTEEEHFYEGQYACSYENVHSNLTEHGLDWDRAHLIRGFFEDTLTNATKEEHGMGPAAVALVDCDLYASSAEVLGFLSDLLVDGSVLIMDDWNAFDGRDDRGQRRALAEFLEEHSKWRVEPWFEYGSYGRAFIVHRQTSRAGTEDVARRPATARPDSRRPGRKSSRSTEGQT